MNQLIESNVILINLPKSVHDMRKSTHGKKGVATDGPNFPFLSFWNLKTIYGKPIDLHLYLICRLILAHFLVMVIKKQNCKKQRIKKETKLQKQKTHRDTRDEDAVNTDSQTAGAVVPNGTESHIGHTDATPKHFMAMLGLD